MNETDERFIHLLRAGTSLLRQGKSAEALPYLKEAYTLEPENLDVSLNLSGAYILEKQFRKAVPILERLAQEHPDNAMVQINLGAAYLGNPALAVNKHHEQAIAAFKRALEIDPRAPSAAYNIGLIYRDRGDIEDAIPWFRRALQANPRDEHARSILARLEGEEEE